MSLQECLRAELCKFAEKEPCIHVCYCKYYEVTEPQKKAGPGRKRKDVPHHKAENPDVEYEGKVTKSMLLKARIKLANLKQQDKLDENQVRALDATKGLRFSKMTDTQKAQVVRMADEGSN